MRQRKVSSALKKDREIREALAGYGIAATLFGLWSLIRFPSLFVFSDERGPVFTLLQAIITISISCVFILCIRRYLEVKNMRKKLIENPEIANDLAVPKPLLLTTIIPFILK